MRVYIVGVGVCAFVCMHMCVWYYVYCTEHCLPCLSPIIPHPSNQVRERLRSAIERNSLLEDELLLANQELKALQEELDRTQKVLRRRSTVRMSFTAVEEAAFSKEQVGRAGTSGWGTSGPM